MKPSNKPKRAQNFNLHTKAAFKIEVKGKVDKKLSDYLCGLRISHFKNTENIYFSRLTGDILDQAALMGVLNALYDMRFPIVKLKMTHKKES